MHTKNGYHHQSTNTNMECASCRIERDKLHRVPPMAREWIEPIWKEPIWLSQGQEQAQGQGQGQAQGLRSQSPIQR